MIESDWEFAVMREGRPDTLQNLVDLWTTTVWSLISSDQKVDLDKSSTAPEISTCFSIQRDVQAAVAELRSAGKLVGVLAEVAVADIIFKSFLSARARSQMNHVNEDAAPMLQTSKTMLGGKLDPQREQPSSDEPTDDHWRLPVRLGSRSVSLRVVVRGWAAEVWLIFAAQDQSGANPMDWTLDDFVGALSFRSILFRALRDSEHATGRHRTIPSVALTDILFESITQADSQGMLRATTISVMPEDPSGHEWWWGRVPANGPILEEFRSVMERIRSEQ